MYAGRHARNGVFVKNLPIRVARIVNTATTVTAAVLPVLVEQHVITVAAAAYIGSIVASLAVGHKSTTAAANYDTRQQQGVQQ